jgi:hypothetical protein
MIIFQTAGGDAGALGLKGGLLDARPPATTFRNNAYIHRLNRTLQAEMRAVSAYRTLKDRPAFDELAAGHQLAGKELVRLIIANRGIPEDRSALSLGLTRRFIHLCAALPSRLSGRVATSTLRQLERQLVVSYRKLMGLAPGCDLPILADLLKAAERQARKLDATSGDGDHGSH